MNYELFRTFASTMTYEALWHRLTPLYDEGEAKAVARWVLEVRFGLSLADILCGKDTELSANNQAELEKIAERLEKGEPVQYVLGVADFCDRQFLVAPGVLIPRPETAELVQWCLQEGADASRILDVGTGSGCIAVTLAAALPEAQVTAWDISDEALYIARENAKRTRVHVSFERQDALNPPTDEACWDLIVSNPPYIQPTERDGMAKNVLDFEPGIALFAPADRPIVFYQRIGDYAIQSLKPGGSLYFELNPLTAEYVAIYLRQLGFRQVVIRQDQFGKDRFLKAMKIC